LTTVTEPRLDPPPLASAAHTGALVGVMLAVALAGSVLQHFGALQASGAAVASPRGAIIWRQYLPLLLVNALLLLYVARLFRPGNALPQLLGRRWSTASQAFADLLSAACAFAVICGLEALAAPFFAGRNAAVSALLPSTEAERLTWVAVASVVGFCEEVVYRGYLQTQLGAIARSPGLGLTLQALLFGLSHLEQGGGAALRIAIYGLILGLLAHTRRSLLPGIGCHVAIDLVSALGR